MGGSYFSRPSVAVRSAPTMNAEWVGMRSPCEISPRSLIVLTRLRREPASLPARPHSCSHSSGTMASRGMYTPRSVFSNESVRTTHCQPKTWAIDNESAFGWGSRTTGTTSAANLDTACLQFGRDQRPEVWILLDQDCVAPHLARDLADRARASHWVQDRVVRITE